MQSSWDARDLLVEVKTRVVAAIPAAARVRIVNEYDAFARRVEKKVYRWDSGTNAWSTTPASIRRFVYDGWKVIAEQKVDPGSGNAKTLRSFVWGLDLSGTWGGAAGVGGLLAVRHHNPADNAVTATYYTLRDARGNVAGLVDAATSGPTAGKLIVGFEYGPFGGLSAIDSADPAVLCDPALLCPLLFSTSD